MLESEKLKTLAYQLRLRASTPEIGVNRKVALEMAERFETLALEHEKLEATEIKRLFDTAA